MIFDKIDIPCLTDTQKIALIEAAEQTALRYCAPVYLVGSSLSSLYPRDLDIFIAVKGDSYLRLFTNYNKKTEHEGEGCHTKNAVAMQVQQARIYQKNKAYFESKVKGWDFDVKFQNIDQFLQHKGDKLRLDLVYEKLW